MQEIAEAGASLAGTVGALMSIALIGAAYFLPTIVARKPDVDALIASLTPTAGQTADFLAANRANIIDVSADSEQVWRASGEAILQTTWAIA